MSSIQYAEATSTDQAVGCNYYGAIRFIATRDGSDDPQPYSQTQVVSLNLGNSSASTAYTPVSGLIKLPTSVLGAPAGPSQTALAEFFLECRKAEAVIYVDNVSVVQI